MSLVSSLLLRSLRKHPSHACINALTYLDLHNLVIKKQEILASHKIQPHDRVVVMTDTKAPQQLAMMIAAWEAGAVVVPLADSQSKVVLPRIQADLVMEQNGRIFSPSQKRPRPLLPAVTTPKDPAVIMFTSGTTSEPRGVVLSHDNITSNLAMLDLRYQDYIQPTDRSFSVLPWHHCYGMVCELLFMMNRGAHVCVPTTHGLRPTRLMGEIRWNRPTLMFTVPKMLERIIHSGLPRFLCRPLLFGTQLRMMSVGGAYCSPRLLARAQQLLQIPVYQGYGLTETGPMVSLNSPEEYNPESVGKPLKGVELSVGKEGEIIVCSPSVMKGYFSHIDPSTNQVQVEVSESSPACFPTGDRGRIDEEGFVFIEGRLGTRFKLTNGKFIDPVVVESVIMENCPRLEQVVIIPEEDMRGSICLFYSSCDTSVEAILLRISHSLQAYEIPRRVYRMRSPLTVQSGLLSLKLEPRRPVIRKIWPSLV